MGDYATATRPGFKIRCPSGTGRPPPGAGRAPCRDVAPLRRESTGAAGADARPRGDRGEFVVATASRVVIELAESNQSTTYWVDFTKSETAFVLMPAPTGFITDLTLTME